MSEKILNRENFIDLYEKYGFYGSMHSDALVSEIEDFINLYKKNNEIELIYRIEHMCKVLKERYKILYDVE